MNISSDPLRSYLSSHGGHISDWGIDDVPFNIDGSHNTNHNRITDNYGKYSKFIKSSLNASFTLKFWEQFKYNLIISNLLDDSSSLSLSKNDQYINQLLTDKNGPKYKLNKSMRTSDYELLLVNNSFQLYFNDSNNDFNVILIVFLIIYLLKKLQNINSSTYNKINKSNNFSIIKKMIKLLILLSFKYISNKKMFLTIQSNKISVQLNQFLINNYKLNKNIIRNLNYAREYHIYMKIKTSPTFGTAGLNVVPLSTTQFSAEKLVLFENILNLLISNFKNHCFKMIIYLNGELIEKNCYINNIDLGLMATDLSTSATVPPSVENIAEKIKILNTFRKFLLIELLTINENFELNIYLNKIWNLFNYHVNEKGTEINDSPEKFLKNDEKLLLIHQILHSSNDFMTNFNRLFEDINTPTAFSGHAINDDAFLTSLIHRDETNMNKLIKKLALVIKTLESINTYSSVNSNKGSQIDSEEKTKCLQEVMSELSHSISLNKLCISDTLSIPRNSSSSSTPVTNKENGKSLKNFNNLSIRKKRFSLPVPSSAMPLSPLSPISSNGGTSEGKKYKKLSTGLNLLTIFEENSSRSAKYNLNNTKEDASREMDDTKKKMISFDDNYLNIIPNYDSFMSPVQDHQEYLQNSVDVNVVNNGVGLNRYSMTNTTISDINNDEYELLHNSSLHKINTSISISHDAGLDERNDNGGGLLSNFVPYSSGDDSLTKREDDSEGDDEDQVLSRDKLRFQLELNLNKLYIASSIHSREPDENYVKEKVDGVSLDDYRENYNYDDNEETEGVKSKIKVDFLNELEGLLQK